MGETQEFTAEDLEAMHKDFISDIIEGEFPMLERHMTKLMRVEKYVGQTALLFALKKWNRPERHYHNLTHMTELFECFDKEVDTLPNVSEFDKDVMLCAIVYHDVVYDPRATFPENEDKSIEMWNDHLHPGYKDHPIAGHVSKLIDATKDHTSMPDSEMAQMFVRWDLANLMSDDLNVLIAGERKILKEYQFHDYELYRAGRLEILNKFKPFILSLNPDSKIDSLIQYVEARKLKVAIFAGSFFPMHAGHYSIIKRAEQAFDKVIIAPGYNPVKSRTPENDKYLEKLKTEILPYHQVEMFSGLLTDYVKSKKSDYVEPSVIKGLGRPGDFEEEKMQLRYMEDMDPDINVAMFISHREFDYVSSTGARIVENLAPDFYHRYALDQWPDAEVKITEAKEKHLATIKKYKQS